MTLLAVAASVVLLVLLVSWLRVQPFLAFVVASGVAAALVGLPPDRIAASIAHGIGDMLGSLAVILCLGAMFGRVIADSGAAERIADTLIGWAGTRRIALAMAATGFVVGLPLFYNVGFVLLVPLIFTVVARTRQPAVALGIPMLSGLSIAHGYLPPHPSPTALVQAFGADLGRTLLLGLIVAVPTLLIAGPLFARTLRGIEARPAAVAAPAAASDAPRVLPGAGASFACVALPVLLLAGATLLAGRPDLPPLLRATLATLGQPMLAMLIALAVATLVLQRRAGLARIGEGQAAAVRDIAGILLILGGAGALKQVLVDAGADARIAASLSTLSMPPLLLGWTLALVLRVALGSATVAGLTAAAIVRPIVAGGGVDPSLMVLAIGGGSLMCSHVNDSGFWMFKEYFGLSLRDTFRSWSAMETLAGFFGLIFTLLLSLCI